MKTGIALGTILTLGLGLALVTSAGWLPSDAAAAAPRLQEQPSVDGAPAPTVPVTANAAGTIDLTPLQQEIRQLLTRESSRIEALVARIEQERDPVRVIELQRKVEAAKRDGRIAVLGAQLRFARQEGRTESAASIEAALESAQATAAPTGGR